MIVRRLTVTREWIKGIGRASDSIGAFIDAATKQVGKGRGGTDSFAIADSAGPYDQAVDGPIVFSDAATQGHAVNPSASDTFSIRDVVSRLADKFTISDSAKAQTGVNAHDSFSVFDGQRRQASDGMQVYDEIVRTPQDSFAIGDVAGINIRRSAADSFTISDSA